MASCENCQQPPDDDYDVLPLTCGHDICEDCARYGCPLCLLADTMVASDPARPGTDQTIKQRLPPADLLTVMRALYASEINCGMYSFWDMGFCVFLGDETNGIKIQRWFDSGTLFSAAAWLDQKAREYFPDSDYARKEPA